MVHGGPGTPGEVAPVACELSSESGVLEPLQTADSVTGQIEELRFFLAENGDIPLVLVGHSWGAWLAFLVTAYYPRLIRKLILIGSGPFEPEYAAQIMPARLKRLMGQEKEEALRLMQAMNSPGFADSAVMARVGELMGKTEYYDPLPDDGGGLPLDPHIYSRVWEEASRMRRSGELLKLAEKITCPVVAIHGDYDSHPAAGVQVPLARRLKDFRFILLEKCGHKPWIERRAKDEFYKILKREIRN